MLRTRVITALILAAAIIAAIYLLDTSWLGVILGLFTAAAAWEWSALARIEGQFQRVLYVAAAVGLTFGFFFLVTPVVLLWVLVVVWIIATIAVLTWPRSRHWIASPAVVAGLGLLILPGVLVALLVIHGLPNGGHWLLFALLICWAADIGAYFAGKGFGRNKLAVNVSPGKTWEGALGGLLLALLVCGGLLFAAGVLDGFWILILTGLVAVSIIGDLFESLLKRASGAKDSGSLLPGHGGVLDRIDSVLAVSPFFALWLMSQAP